MTEAMRRTAARLLRTTVPQGVAARMAPMGATNRCRATTREPIGARDWNRLRNRRPGRVTHRRRSATVHGGRGVPRGVGTSGHIVRPTRAAPPAFEQDGFANTEKRGRPAPLGCARGVCGRLQRGGRGRPRVEPVCRQRSAAVRLEGAGSGYPSQSCAPIRSASRQQSNLSCHARVSSLQMSAGPHTMVRSVTRRTETRRAFYGMLLDSRDTAHPPPCGESRSRPPLLAHSFQAPLP